MIFPLLALLAGPSAFASPSFPTAPCSARDAIRASVTQIASQPARYFGRCVTVSGAMSGVSLYSGREGLYRAFHYGADGNQTAADRTHRIGLDSQQLRELRVRQPLASTVTGRVDSCEARQARAERAAASHGEPAIMLLGGYCHFQNGPTIVVSAFRITERGYERLTGEAARRTFGNLVPMPDDWPQRAAIESLVSEFLTALRAGDRGALAALHDIRPATTNESDREILSWLSDNQYSPFVQFRHAAPSQTAIFVSASDGVPIGSDGHIAARACFCRAGDCTGRWPISTNDADSDEARPYACTAIEPRDWTSRHAGFRTQVRTNGWLAEPASSAFRVVGNNSTR